jgi:hypothetical protein
VAALLLLDLRVFEALATAFLQYLEEYVGGCRIIQCRLHRLVVCKLQQLQQRNCQLHGMHEALLV